jgi:N-acetyl-gamma-glutamyl-phosphate reductase
MTMMSTVGREQVTVGVAGATGYAGQELIRLLARHPRVRLVAAMASSASSPNRALPALAHLWDGAVVPLDLDRLASEADAVFLALPEDASAEIVPALLERGRRVFDLSGAYRLRDTEQRTRWYPKAAALPDGSVYGLTETARAALPAARLVACPGCYPTPAVLALHPLIEAGLVTGDIIVDAKSGISGAGKAPTERTHFSECHGSVSAYGVFAHRHAAEIEQELGQRVTFVPHLVPLDRGILETIYTRLRPHADAPAVAAAYERAYGAAPFVRLTGEVLPTIRQVAWTNFCDIGWKVDEPGGRLVVVSSIDNLLKGAAGQALQNFNVAFGFDERAGLWP